MSDLNKKDKNKENQKQPFWERMTTTGWLLFFAALALLGAYLFKDKINDYIFRTKKFTKKALREPYNVSNDTFNKWVFYFCNPELINYEDYLKKRKLSYFEYSNIRYCLGVPTEKTPVLLKKNIADPYADSTGNIHRGLRKSIRKAASAENPIITPEIYAKMDVFPPKIAQLLLRHF